MDAFAASFLDLFKSSPKTSPANQNNNNKGKSDADNNNTNAQQRRSTIGGSDRKSRIIPPTVQRIGNIDIDNLRMAFLLDDPNIEDSFRSIEMRNTALSISINIKDRG